MAEKPDTPKKPGTPEEAEKPAEPPYCEIRDDPAWLAAVSAIPWTRSHYGGLVLRGACPTCNHADGIAVFVPTDWVAVGGGDGAGTAQGAPAVEDVAYVEEVTRDAFTQQWGEHVEEKPPRTPPHSRAPHEVVACTCSESHGTGKTGCGRWGYVPVWIAKRGSRDD